MAVVYVRRLSWVGLSAHAMLAPVSRVCFIGALLTDLTYADSAQVQWTNFSAWLLALGTFFGAIAALVAIVDFWAAHVRPRPGLGLVYIALDIVTLLIALVDNFVHARDGWTSVVPDGLALSAITVVLALVTALVGHQLVAVTAARQSLPGEPS